MGHDDAVVSAITPIERFLPWLPLRARRITSGVLHCPLSNGRPVPAHTMLPKSEWVLVVLECDDRGVVRVAHDFLPEVVQAVVSVPPVFERHIVTLGDVLDQFAKSHLWPWSARLHGHIIRTSASD